MGKWCDIDLSTKTVKIENIDPNYAKKWLGGRGVGVKIVYDRLKPKTDPLSPENIIVFATGPLSGRTGAPSSGRFCTVTKSPLTGTIHDSHCGGDWGHAIKASGFDWIVLSGKADNPTWILLDDGDVIFNDASKLWGKNWFDSERWILETLDPNSKGSSLEELSRNPIGVAGIGPPGEKMKSLACIMNRFYRAAGRGGHGAVLGSKNVKAVVARGNQKIPIHDATAYRAAVKKNENEVMQQGDITKRGGGLYTLGTALLVNVINGAGIYPTNNFQASQFDGADNTSGEALKDHRLIRNIGCKGCRIMCGRWSRIEQGPYAGTECEGFEYETTWSWGADCGVDNIDYVLTAHHICNKYGLDAIQAGTAVAFAMECFEKGIITTQDTFGVELKFGNAAAMVAMAEAMGKVEGLGAVLADGEVVAAKTFGKGARQYAMTSKSQSMPAYDPRGSQAHGLGYATSNRGACHLRAYMIGPEILGAPEQLDRFDPNQKSIDMLVTLQNFVAMLDSALVCQFVSFSMGAQEFANLLNPLTGWNLSVEALDDIGERIWNLERIFNEREGIGKKDDELPKRITQDPISSGPAKGHTVPLTTLLAQYYQTRGWTAAGKVPIALQTKLGI